MKHPVPQAPLEQHYPTHGWKLLRSGTEYFDNLEQLIAGASQSLHLQAYILDPDETGRLVVHWLKKASARGVRVYVLVDGYASQALDTTFVRQLREAGIFFRFFDPLLKSKYFYFGRRLHHKVVVADGTTALVGGINISNRYNDTPDDVAWLDWALLLRGPMVPYLEWLCQRRMRPFFPRLPASFPVRPHPQMGVIVNDWVRNKREITRAYISMLRKAHHEVIIMSSYFLPGRIFRKYLRAASARGVRIHVITAGISDVPISKYAERYMYRWLMRNNIQIYEYQPHVLHAKISVADHEWVTVGSYNVNNISAYASIELNVEVREPVFAKAVSNHLHQIIDMNCVPVTPDTYRAHYGFLSRFLQQGAYMIFRVVFYLFTFYFRQRE
jgi:cardiolipin synthase